MSSVFLQKVLELICFLLILPALVINSEDFMNGQEWEEAGGVDRWERPNMGTFLTAYMHVYYTSE